MSEGTIVKALSGFFYVQDDEDKQIYECRGRGILKKNNVSPLVGDYVNYTSLPGNQGVIEEIKPRKNEFFRPKVANVDQVLLVFTHIEPAWNQRLLDRFIVMAESVDVEAVLVINKIDMLNQEQQLDMETNRQLYEGLGYRVILTSAESGDGKAELLDALKDKISMFSGQSGVGKSSLLNMLDPGLELKTGDISNKLKRGKHTTRHVELFPLANGGYVVDTPGFSQIDLSIIGDSSLIAKFFREINEVGEHCKYRGCTHTAEDSCKVIEYVEQGKIDAQRYKHYTELVEEINDYNKNKY
ncbi:ribosome small subunit-dependent GTPase A [Desulfuribacillus alkaliarsenatis]|uniref:Small ribosomal subunit biogenesis GTPase RsgA n=1 Tax=Desulfuribacillus alkaliarsenatis TaxID=766136 RepID=A0A1E5G605_9FIRM|nr:ribosome small subunit-dependent GTPase A [Desulfuribacillus alkaliarsenatis]OEF98539.1 ribosome small subunit-dependent GTPase A [Desulfuribacillus alkaliarsenatis]